MTPSKAATAVLVRARVAAHLAQVRASALERSYRDAILMLAHAGHYNDSDTGAHIVELLETLNREAGTTIILVTHDLTLAHRAQRIIRLADGAVVSDTMVQPTPAATPPAA